MSAYEGYAVGLDIGGTNMVAGVIAGADGKILARHSVPTESRRGVEDGLKRVGDLIAEVIEGAKLTPNQIVGIGIGATGPVDTLKGLIQNPFTLPGWEDMPINASLSERFGLPCILLIDTHVAALGEHWIGAGQGARHMLYLTFGTGIGCGIIANNQLYRAAGLTSGEVGHHMLDPHGPDCYCGGKGCWEMFAAAPAISKYAAENAPDDSLLAQERDAITPLRVSQAAQRGDAFAQAVMDRTAHYLGIGIANLINIFAPQVVVLGGGIMGSWPQFAPIALQETKRCAAMVPLDLVRISPAVLGLNAGITGAGRAIFAQQSGETSLLPT
ncbi:MAG TPA: ROK family protein [Phototrophicaceae bacterium]|nr:ROK family protein [Phototrophicaceae bacterium]